MAHTRQFSLQTDQVEITFTSIVHRYHRMYHVSFSNGYSNVFFTDVESGRWIEEDLGFTELAHHIGIQLKKYEYAAPMCYKKLEWYHGSSEGNDLTFAFICSVFGSEQIYQVYGANRKFMFNLIHKQNGEWDLLDNGSTHKTNVSIEKILAIVEILKKHNRQESRNI